MDYEELVQDALRGVVKRILKHTEKNGLIDPHHYYISFQTHYPGVHVPNILKEEEPEEATIILQHQFWNLRVQEDYFTVGLMLHNKASDVCIPFQALLNFVDPVAKFGLQFSPPPYENVTPADPSIESVGSAQEKSRDDNIIHVEFPRRS